MIDEKKLVEILSKNSIFEKITNAEGKNIFEIIDDMPKTDWIPCEVEMPKENFCSVWVSFTSPYTSYVRKAYWENGQFVWDNRKPIKDKPVAWMKYYSPQPYKREGAE